MTLERPRVRRRVARLALAASLLGLAVARFAAAQDEGADLEAATRTLKERQAEIDKGREEAATLGAKADTYQTEVDAIRIQSIDVAGRTRALERRLGEIETRVASLSAEAEAQRAALEAGRPSRANAIGAMLRLSRRPPQALMLAPNSAVEATRSALLLAAVSRGLESSARGLRTSLEELVELQDALAAERTWLDDTTRELAGQRAALEGLMQEKAALERGAQAERAESEARVAALVREARDLEELIARLDSGSGGLPLPPPPRPDPASRMASAELPAGVGGAPHVEIHTSALDEEAMREAEAPRQGAFSLPAEGAIVRYFGAPTAPGVTAKGMSISARPGGPVVAPFAGKVVFAGPFRDYGQLLIIAHGEGYHTLLAGLGRIDTAVGRWVLAGEPIGNMSSTPETRPQLYLELRHKGRPVNPLPWLATGPIKSSGS